jgi:hypothetical protein
MHENSSSATSNSSSNNTQTTAVLVSDKKFTGTCLEGLIWRKFKLTNILQIDDMFRIIEGLANRALEISANWDKVLRR